MFTSNLSWILHICFWHIVTFITQYTKIWCMYNYFICIVKMFILTNIIILTEFDVVTYICNQIISSFMVFFWISYEIMRPYLSLVDKMWYDMNRNYRAWCSIRLHQTGNLSKLMKEWRGKINAKRFLPSKTYVVYLNIFYDIKKLQLTSWAHVTKI